MSDPDNFLTRWSRRKRAAAGSEAEQASASPLAEKAADEEHARADQAKADAAAPAPVEAIEPPFDLTRLPSLDSITAESDIRAFLAPGVPPDLTRAALRRAWVADPKIRNFVGLADYDWDYHAPGSMVGFGPLEMTDELRRLVARMVGGETPADAAATSQLDPASPPSPATTAQTLIESEDRPATAAGLPKQVDAKQLGIMQEEAARHNDEPRSHKELAKHEKEPAAPQHELDECDNLRAIIPRSHGRALPK